MTHETEIAQRMRGMREDCGYSKEQMAAQLSMDAAEYEAYENGQSEIPVSVMQGTGRWQQAQRRLWL